MENRKLLLTTLIMSLLWGCSSAPDFSEFPLKSNFSMTTEDYETVRGAKTDFRPYLTPFGRAEYDDKMVLFGFIFFVEEYIQGVAYLVDQEGLVLDTLNVSVVDPPNRVWAEVGEEIIILESGGIMDEGPLPPGRTSASWTDTLVYLVGQSEFEKSN